MIDDWLNQDPDDGFNPNDHDIEMDEVCLRELQGVTDESEEIR